MTLSSGARLGPYEILARLGSGGMGDVFSAKDARLNRTVAIKTIAPDRRSGSGFEERFQREAQTVAALSHPNIVTIHDVGFDAGHHFMVMELLQGETLRDRLDRGPLSLAELVGIGSHIADALSAAHAVGLLHRDLKPANIFLTDAGTPKLMDFGIAKRLTEHDGETMAGLTATGEIVGTLLYMSPEQARGLTLDERSDVFSLAAVLYEMATGQPPFRGQGVLDTLLAITTQPPAPLGHVRPDLPAAFESLVTRALAKDVDDRVPSARALADGLRAVAREAASDLPPTARVPAPGHRIVNLPAPLTKFVGRQRDVATVREMLRSPDIRLLNCTGPAGVGKTRLAIEVTGMAAPDFADGVAFVALESVRDSADVLFELTKALRLREDSSRAPREALVEFLRSRSFLVTVDNFEHVVAAAPLLSDLLAACPHLKFLITSRTTLNVRAERQFEVDPLGTTAADHQAAAYGSAVELFLDRARIARPDIDASPAGLTTIAAICRQLDGLPLAIELAAARTRLLTPSQLLARLDNRLRFLSSSIRDLPERQRTLRGAIDWSYELLSPADRQLLHRLAVFAGGATLESVEAVCGDAMDSLLSLVDSHLLRRTGAPAGTVRVSMLEMVREYALEQLQASEEAEAIRLRYAEHYLDFAERADRQLCATPGGDVLDHLEAEYVNCRAACDLFVARGRIESALRVCLALWRFWEARGYWTEGRHELERLLTTAGANAPLELRAGAFYAAGVLADAQRDFEGARRLFEEHLSIQRQVADPRAIASAMNNLGVVAMRQGDVAAAENFYTETLSIVRQSGLAASEAASLNNLGHLALRRSQYETARSCYEDSLRISQRLGDLRAVAWTVSNLGDASWEEGDFAGAERHYAHSLGLFRQIGDKPGQASCMADLGDVAARAGNLQLAASLYQESLVGFAELGDKRGIVRSVEGFTGLAAARHQTAHTLRLAAVAQALRLSLGMEPSASRRTRLLSAIDAARAAAGPNGDAWWAEGESMPIEDALRYALESALS